MNQQLLEKYAQVIVRIGANVQPGQKVRLQAEVQQLPLVEAITKECYEAGASFVEVIWTAGTISKLHYQYAETETLGTVLPWEEARAKQMAEDLPVRIFVDSADPDQLSGISADKLSTVRQMQSKVLKKYRDAMDGRHQWLIVAAPSVNWAKKVFPHDTDEAAVEKLWDAILACVYLTEENDPVAVWKEHTAQMSRRADWLNKQQFTKLHYESANGTDFTVGLIPGARWEGARDINHTNNAPYVPNMPTEEVFTSPMRGVCEGTLVSTKPLSWSGQVIDRFSVTYRDGKVVSCQAERGEEALSKMFAMDEGAAMLGEIALVPKESPINQSNLLFYNTLFDENACCHVAAGFGFGEVIDGYLEMTKQELQDIGVNDSMIHVDFMVGSDDLHITGIRADGSTEDIFVNGTWAQPI